MEFSAGGYGQQQPNGQHGQFNVSAMQPQAQGGYASNGSMMMGAPNFMSAGNDMGMMGQYGNASLQPFPLNDPMNVSGFAQGSAAGYQPSGMQSNVVGGYQASGIPQQPQLQQMQVGMGMPDAGMRPQYGRSSMYTSAAQTVAPHQPTGAASNDLFAALQQLVTPGSSAQQAGISTAPPTGSGAPVAATGLPSFQFQQHSQAAQPLPVAMAPPAGSPPAQAAAGGSVPQQQSQDGYVSYQHVDAHSAAAAALQAALGGGAGAGMGGGGSGSSHAGYGDQIPSAGFSNAYGSAPADAAAAGAGDASASAGGGSGSGSDDPFDFGGDAGGDAAAAGGSGGDDGFDFGVGGDAPTGADAQLRDASGAQALDGGDYGDDGGGVAFLVEDDSEAIAAAGPIVPGQRPSRFALAAMRKVPNLGGASAAAANSALIYQRQQQQAQAAQGGPGLGGPDGSASAPGGGGDFSLSDGIAALGAGGRMVGGGSVWDELGVPMPDPAGIKLPPDDKVTLFDVDPFLYDSKGWLVPSADPTDYFNYGLTEDSWRKYSRLQTRVRQEMRQLQYAAMGVAPPAQSVRPHALSAAIKEPNLKNTSNNSSNTSGGGGGALPSPQAAASGGGGGGNANNVPLGTGTGGMAGFKRERE